MDRLLIVTAIMSYISLLATDWRTSATTVHAGVMCCYALAVAIGTTGMPRRISHSDFTWY